MKILVTGSAGFIGSYLARSLLQRGDEVVGIDSINEYYAISLKLARLEQAGIASAQLQTYSSDSDISSSSQLAAIQSDFYPNYRFQKLDIEDSQALNRLFASEQFDAVCHLAAQAGVRYSLENPLAYVRTNMLGFANVLEACRHNGVKNLCYASSSSVYGLNQVYPFSTSHNVDHPVSLYAASKKSNELMAHTYSHLYGIRTTGLRFFTVYGPWGRPDMAYFSFTKKALEGTPIQVFNHGQMLRDFTYIDDIVEGIVRVIDNPAKADSNWSGTQPSPASSSAPYKLYNIGNNTPVKLMDFIETLETALGIKMHKEMLPMQAGDVQQTFANVDDLVNDLDYRPSTPLHEGIDKFVRWYRDYYGV